MTNQAATRLLLALWELGGAKQEVNKGKLHDRIKSKDKKIADFKEIFDELKQKGAIVISKKGYTLASPQGLAVLSEGLKSGDFKFEGTIVGTWAANALIKWIGEMDGADVPVNGVKTEIKSYDEFEKVTLEVYDKLNRDYNLNDLVPIYRIRREIGDRTSRENFSDWLLEMQANDIFQLMAGEMPDITPDKRDDSITIPGGGLRYYAKHLS
ncbi:MAG: hypothetical protein KME54_06490 [Tolypothrix brevis GSE-NOS-MK-07-07A]|nr:hypothetical protein [Tolypothrix brevis GSE-NOS-MK-07-07A]